MQKFTNLLYKCCLTLSLFSCPINADSTLDKYIFPITLEHENSGIPLIDCIYVINLEKRLEKWVKSRDEFLKYSIYPNRVNAFDGWKLNNDQMQELMGKHPVRMRGGQMGCLISHLSAIKDGYDRGFKCIWICEDDVILCQNPSVLSDYILDLYDSHPNWDILFTDMDSNDKYGNPIPSLASDFRPGFPHAHPVYYLQRESINEQLMRIRQRFGAYSMIISKSGMEKILNHFAKLPVWTAYDIDIHYVLDIQEFALKNPLVSSKCSNISDTEIAHE